MTTSYEKVFIETSTIVDYTLKSDRREVIENILNRYKIKISSNYVRMELKRGVIQNLVYLHNKIVLCNNWSEVMKAISSLSSTPQRHKLGTVLEMIYEFFKTIENEPLEDIGDGTLSDNLKKRCSTFIRLCIRRLCNKFEEMIDEDINPMLCFVDINPPIMGSIIDNSKQRTCNKSDFECKIKDFFGERNKDFSKILNELKKIPESDVDSETGKRIKSMKEIIRLLPFNNRKFSNKENKERCWDCGDAILAVTSPKEAHVLHHNTKHFNPICKSIDRTDVTY